MDETELIKKCQAGDKEAFEKLYHQYKDKVFGVVYYMLGDEDEAIEVTQQVFIKIYKEIYRFGFKSKLYTWLHRVTTNYCLDHLKKMKRRKSVPLDSVNELSGFIVHQSPEEFHIKMQVCEAVRKVIMTLKPKLRDVIVLKYINGLSQPEIAETLGCSVGAVYTRLNRGHSVLSEKLSFLKE